MWTYIRLFHRIMLNRWEDGFIVEAMDCRAGAPVQAGYCDRGMAAMVRADARGAAERDPRVAAAAGARRLRSRRTITPSMN